jgi:anti-sigma factor RsiW
MNQSCQTSSLELGQFRDGALPSADTARIAAHAESCQRCQGRLADMETLGELLTERRALLGAELGPNFAANVMRLLPEPRATSTWSEWLAATVRGHRDAFVFSLLAVGVAAALLVVFAPGLRSEADRNQEAAENEAQIHQLDVAGTDQSAVILQSAEGNTVIWLVPAAEAEEEAAKPTGPE